MEFLQHKKFISLQLNVWNYICILCSFYFIFGHSIQTIVAFQIEQISYPTTTTTEATFNNAVNEAFTVMPDDNTNDNEDATQEQQQPEEIQKAVCTVTAGEVRASAEAVTTKQIKGVCGSAELHLALNKLEKKLQNELLELKSLLLQHLQQQTAHATKQHSTSTRTTTTAATISKNLHKIPLTKSLSAKRDDEVKKFNNTLFADRDIKMFTYYWKLENFTTHIESGEIHELESPIFSITGKPLQLKAYFQHLQRDFLYLQLQYATQQQQQIKNNNVTNYNNNNIIMEMGMGADIVAGTLFKEIVSDNKIQFKHKISILDQHNRHAKDLVSQEFHNLNNGFIVPNSALLGSSPYIKQNALKNWNLLSIKREIQLKEKKSYRSCTSF